MYWYAIVMFPKGRVGAYGPYYEEIDAALKLIEVENEIPGAMGWDVYPSDKSDKNMALLDFALERSLIYKGGTKVG